MKVSKLVLAIGLALGASTSMIACSSASKQSEAVTTATETTPTAQETKAAAPATADLGATSSGRAH